MPANVDGAAFGEAIIGHARPRRGLIVGEATVEAEFEDVWSDTELNDELVAYVRRYAAEFAGSGGDMAVDFVERVVALEGPELNAFSGARLAEEVVDGEPHLQASLCWFRSTTAELLGFRKIKPAHLAEQCTNPPLDGLERVGRAVKLQTRSGLCLRDVLRGNIGRVDPPEQRRELDVTYYWLADRGARIAILEVVTGPPVNYDLALALSDRLASSVRITT